MPTIRLSTETLQLIREQTLPGFEFVSIARRRDDGDWDVPIDDEVAYMVANARQPNESDDDAVSRLVRASAVRGRTRKFTSACAASAVQ